MKGMSAHPDDKDVSFEELMEQYRQYEVSSRLAFTLNARKLDMPV